MMRDGMLPPINDGGGLYDSEGLCDTLVSDCNNLVKYVCAGQYIQFCNTVVQIVQKLLNLKSGIQADLESKNKTIDELKRINDDLLKTKTGLPEQRGEADGKD